MLTPPPHNDRDALLEGFILLTWALGGILLGTAIGLAIKHFFLH
jgi:hypothetical protein